MIDRLHAFMDRPLRDTDRPRLFALAVVLLLAGAAVLALLDRPAPQPAPQPRAPDPAPAASLPSESVPAATPDPQAPSEEGKPPAAMDISRKQVAAAERAGRRFLTGYLPYSYGRRDARRIPAASERLRARLAREHPRVPPDVRKRRPQVVLLHAHGVARRNAELMALVSDGAHSYSVLLELERAPAGWRVTDVGS
jgi:hypothetical protein